MYFSQQEKKKYSEMYHVFDSSLISSYFIIIYNKNINI